MPDLPLIGLLFFWSSLAVYRLCRFVIDDSFFEHTREKILHKLVPMQHTIVDLSEGRPQPLQKMRFFALRKKLYEWLTCPYCQSVWYSAIATIIVDHYYDVPLPGFFWLGVCAGSMAAWRYIERN